MNTELSAVEELALSIATCKEIKAACNDKSHPCNLVVMDQEALGTEFRQSPEPWAGNLEIAKLLFVSSNPSISGEDITGENFPKVQFDSAEASHPEWPTEKIIDFHVNRFDQNRDKPYVRAKPMAQYLCRDGEYRGKDGFKPGQQSQKFWTDVFNLSKFMYNAEFDISNDVCLTEVVHCKSRSEGKFVKPAMPRCSGNYLERTLALSGSKLVVCYGAAARDYFLHSELNDIEVDIDPLNFGFFNKTGPGLYHLGILTCNGQNRIFCALKHSNGRGGGKTFTNALGAELAKELANLFNSIVEGAESVPESRAALLKRLSVK